MRFHFPKVYPITDTSLSGLSLAEQVTRLIDGGATLIQLREKHASPRDFYREAEAAVSIARSRDVRLIINDRVDVALALKADGVHLGQTDLPAGAARTLLGGAAIIGLSTHNAEQVKLGVSEPVDYIAFGPIFETATKDAPDPTIGLEELRRIRRFVKLPLVAIGGMTRSNALEVLASGADSVAMISALLADPASITEALRSMLAELGNS